MKKETNRYVRLTDSGLARIASDDPWTGLPSLETALAGGEGVHRPLDPVARGDVVGSNARRVVGEGVRCSGLVLEIAAELGALELWTGGADEKTQNSELRTDARS